MSPQLHVVMYHYVRDLPNTPFPQIKGMLTADFLRQVSALCDVYEMATMDSVMDFLQGAYSPKRDLCLLTFDDGLKEHYSEVTPILVDYGVQGLFFPISQCLQEHRVAPVHMNHFLLASLDFDVYQRAFFERLEDTMEIGPANLAVDPAVARHAYRWDTLEVATFKYFFNFIVDSDVCNEIVKSIFIDKMSDEESFSSALYLTWEEAKSMQNAGMVFGGHSHQHKPIAKLSDADLEWDLTTCSTLLTTHLHPQSHWPFSYPYGKNDCFNGKAIRKLKELGFACSFSTVTGANQPGDAIFSLRRVDCKDIAIEKRATSHENNIGR